MTNARSDSAIVTTIPCSTPKTTTPRNAASESVASTLSMRQSLRTPRTSMRPTAALMTIAASVADGRNSVSPGHEEDERDDERRADDAGELRARPGLLGDGGARRRRRDGEPAEKASRDVRDPDARHLLASVHRLAASRGEGARQHRAVGERDERDAGRGQRERTDIRPLEPSERGCGKPLRERSDDRQRIGQPEDRGDRHGEDDHDQHAGHRRAQPFEREDHDERAHPERGGERLHLAHAGCLTMLATISCQSDSASIEKPRSLGICEMITMRAIALR